MINDENKQIFDLIFGSERLDDVDNIFFDSDEIEAHVEFMMREDIQDAMWKFLQFDDDEMQDEQEEEVAGNQQMEVYEFN